MSFSTSTRDDEVINRLENEDRQSADALAQSLIRNGWMDASRVAVRAKATGSHRAARVLFDALRIRRNEMAASLARVPIDHHKCPHTSSHQFGDRSNDRRLMYKSP